jgi:hypothetical protein
MTSLTRIVGRLRCWLGAHAWERPPEPAARTVATLFAYTERCQRCRAERDIDRER